MTSIGLQEAVEIILGILVQFYTGSFAILGAIIVSIFFFIMLSKGVGFTFSLALTAPLVAGLATSSWFGNADWVLNTVMLVLGMVYGFILIRLFR